jgi:hypothetical protein
VQERPPRTRERPPHVQESTYTPRREHLYPSARGPIPRPAARAGIEESGSAPTRRTCRACRDSSRCRRDQGGTFGASLVGYVPCRLPGRIQQPPLASREAPAIGRPRPRQRPPRYVRAAQLKPKQYRTSPRAVQDLSPSSTGALAGLQERLPGLGTGNAFRCGDTQPGHDARDDQASEGNVHLLRGVGLALVEPAAQQCHVCTHHTVHDEV